MKKIAVKRNDGGVSIVIPSHEATPELLLRDALACEGYVSHREIDDEQLPQDRYFRNAWTDDNPTETVDVDMPKARDIHMNKLRELRTPVLQQLDIDYMNADKTGDVEAKAEIALKKQQLRDMPENYDLSVAETPEELKLMIPDILQ